MSTNNLPRKGKLTFEILRQRYQFWLELPFVYALSFSLNFFLAVDMIHGDQGTVWDGLPNFGIVLVTALAPLWVLLWFNIRGKKLFVLGRLAHRAAVYLRGNQADGIDTYYIFALRLRKIGDPDWTSQLQWNDEGHTRWAQALEEAWKEKYGAS